MFKKMKKAIRETLSENGVMSWSRVASSILLIYGIHWVNMIVKHGFTLPDLLGLTALIVAPYGVNRAAAAAQAAAQSLGNNPTPKPVVVASAPVVVVGPTGQSLVPPVQGPSPDET